MWYYWCSKLHETGFSSSTVVPSPVSVIPPMLHTHSLLRQQRHETAGIESVFRWHIYKHSITFQITWIFDSYKICTRRKINWNFNTIKKGEEWWLKGRMLQYFEQEKGWLTDAACSTTEDNLHTYTVQASTYSFIHTSTYCQPSWVAGVKWPDHEADGSAPSSAELHV